LVQSAIGSESITASTDGTADGASTANAERRPDVALSIETVLECDERCDALRRGCSADRQQQPIDGRVDDLGDSCHNVVHRGPARSQLLACVLGAPRSIGDSVADLLDPISATEVNLTHEIVPR
jgi:hypothetical protein